MRTRVVLITAVSLLLAGSVVAQKKQLSSKDMAKLFKLLETGEHYKVRYKTARVLGMMRKPEALPHLIRALRKDPDHMVRSACAWSMGSINHPGSVADLHRASEKDVAMVKKTAKRALNHVLASFPDNLPKDGAYRIKLDELVDKFDRKQELTKWVQHFFAEQFIDLDNVEMGEEMNIEEDGEKPDSIESFRPVMGFSLQGGVTAVEVPAARAAGQVTVTVELSVMFQPVEVKALDAKKYVGTTDFSGGDKPDDPWVDDPLLEAQKVALKMAVGKGFGDVSKFLHLKK